MSPLQELLARAAVANEEAIRRGIAAMERAEIESPFAGFLRMVEIQQRYPRKGTGTPASRNTVYRKLRRIGVVEPAKKIGGESYFREADVVKAFDPGAWKQAAI